MDQIDYKTMKENNKIVIFGKGLDTRYIHITDVTDLIYKITNGKNGIYNLAAGNSYTFISLAKNKKINKNLNIDLILTHPRVESLKFIKK